MSASARSPGVDAIIAETHDERAPILVKLRDIIHAADPAIVDALDLALAASRFLINLRLIQAVFQRLLIGLFRLPNAIAPPP